MTVRELAEKLELRILSMPDPEREISGAYAGDLLSWVMGKAKEDSVWATIMTNVKRHRSRFACGHCGERHM